MSMNLREILRGFNEAVNETALAKSDFYRQVISEIKATVSRQRPRLNEKGEPIYVEREIIVTDIDGNEIIEDDGKPLKTKVKIPVLEKVSIDEMISGIYSLGSRGSKINYVPNHFIQRIGRETTYSRILNRSGMYQRHSDHLQELTRQDIELVIKIILPDLARIAMPAHMKLAESVTKTPQQITDFQQTYSPSTDLTKQQGI